MYLNSKHYIYFLKKSSGISYVFNVENLLSNICYTQIMKLSFTEFVKKSLSNFIEAIVNILIFLPYFFSVLSLIKTLFYPWKSIISKKTTVGFSFDDTLNRFFYNLISRSIGFVMRFSILIFYLLFQTAYVILLPVFFFFYLLFIPILYFEYLLKTPEEIIKNNLRNDFLLKRCLKQENKKKVEDWFEKYYADYVQKISWWKLSNLFSTPPLARDWAVGYTPSLDQYAFNLVHTDYQSQKKHIIDRQNEIKLIEQGLSKSNGANVIIVGEEGVGKHTIIDALTKKIYEGKTIHSLMYKRLLKLNMEKILNQFTDIKQRENLFDELLSEAAEADSVILMIENINRYLTTGEGCVDLTGSIEKFSNSKTIQIIGTTTPFLYEKIISPNEKIRRMFTKIDVSEISEDDALLIILDVVFQYESAHKVIVPYETIADIIQKSSFYITYIPFPEKAVDLLDSCCIYTNQNRSADKKNFPIVTTDVVDIVLSEKTHIPTTLSANLKEKLVQLEKLLKDDIVQQDEAIQLVSSAIRRSFILMGKRKKPLATFMFLGPTGVGKTQTAKAINTTFFGNKNLILRFDMSLYQSKYDIPKLIGSMEQSIPGLLTSSIREQQYGVLLLDEIEKADKELLNIFLTILDEGYFTDGYGKQVDCKNLVIVATSNAGSDYLFKKLNTTTDEIINILVENRVFTPEFLNRFDGIVLYKPLSMDAVVAIAKKHITSIAEDIYKLHKIYLKVEDEYIKQIAQKSYDQKFGARNMKRIIRQEIEDKVADLLLTNKVKEEETIRL